MDTTEMNAQILTGDCLELLNLAALATHGITQQVALTFFDPPFNQGKKYAHFNDSLPEDEYWGWVRCILVSVASVTAEGGAFYFMQREKNTEHVISVLRDTGWTLQNLIIWKKLTSAVPSQYRYGKQYQIIAFATKGTRARTFNRLRIDLPLRAGQKLPRTNGVYVTDVWDDIRELTSGYFAGDEAIRQSGGTRLHEQQSPIALLNRIILSSSNPGDLILDPCAGTGTALVVAEQLGRVSVGMEIDSDNAKLIETRLSEHRVADSIERLRDYYRYTDILDELWPL
jgi:site-specific DNA-methyltransferase (adenine-specific)